jgi:beta-N-acetylhexosaminidase
MAASSGTFPSAIMHLFGTPAQGQTSQPDVISMPRLRAVAAVVTVACLLAVTAEPQPAAAAYDPANPATWPNRLLAAQLTFSCVAASDLAAARRQAAAGVGGITLLGNTAPRTLGRQLGAVRAAAPARVQPFIGSDEEGGAVQRLRYLIYRLPSAKTMGTWSQQRLRATAYRYGRRMRALGVTLDFAPVADLAIPGYYMDSLRRAFARDPHRVAVMADAWRSGMAAAGVVTAVKHWPGHGQAVNSHTGPARAPPLRTLAARDMIPFDDAFARRTPIVMVGHLMSAGLTERGVPASESPHALHYLRGRAGPGIVIITDDVGMAAASSALGVSPAAAAVRALRAGADWALACTGAPTAVIRAIQDAIGTGRLPRAQAVASVRRIIALKTRSGLLARGVVPGPAGDGVGRVRSASGRGDDHPSAAAGPLRDGGGRCGAGALPEHRAQHRPGPAPSGPRP